MLVTRGLQGGRTSKDGFDQVQQLDQKVEDIDALCGDQTDIQGQLQPATGKNEVGKRTKRRSFGDDGFGR